jgi:transposase
VWSSAEAIAISREEKMLLEQSLSAGSTPQNVAFRIRIILSAAEGVSNNELAGRLSTRRMTILKRRQRFTELGVEGILADARRSGRKKHISPEKEAAIVEATLKTKPRNATHWSTRLMAVTQKWRAFEEGRQYFRPRRKRKQQEKTIRTTRQTATPVHFQSADTGLPVRSRLTSLPSPYRATISSKSWPSVLTESPPAATMIIAGLSDTRMKIEIEVTACRAWVGTALAAETNESSLP